MNNPGYGGFQHDDIDSVNMANGNVTLHIPLLSYPQRGKLKLSFSIVENNKSWYVHIGKVGGQGETANWATSGGSTWIVPDQSMVFTLSNVPWTDDYNKKWTLHLKTATSSDGASHELLGGLPVLNDSNNSWAYSTDGTGIYWDGSSLWDRDGLKYEGGKLIPTSNTVYVPGNVTDPNGNEITYGSNGWTDTMGRVIPGVISLL